MRSILIWYKYHIGVSFKISRVHCNGVSCNKGHYCIISRHPKKSITWLWAVYYDIDMPWYKRIYLKTQKAMYEKD